MALAGVAGPESTGDGTHYMLISLSVCKLLTAVCATIGKAGKGVSILPIFKTYLSMYTSISCLATILQALLNLGLDGHDV